MKCVEFVVYSYFLRNFPIELSWLKRVLLGVNVCRQRTLKIVLPARRMSGETNTSLGNGLTNYFVYSYACRYCSIPLYAAFVEGDDGLFQTGGSPPPEHIFSSLGFELKIQAHSSWNHAHFCGMHMCIVEGEPYILKDPYHLISHIGWTTSAQKLSTKRHVRCGLLRAKAYSLAYELPGTPIAGALARYLLRVTAGVDPIWDYDGYHDAIPKDVDIQRLANRPVPDQVRREAQKDFGCSVAEQREIESYLDGCTSLQPIPRALIRGAPKEWEFLEDAYRKSITYFTLIGVPTVS
jgi:hypothetical protein